MSKLDKKNLAFELKGSLFTLTVIHLLKTDPNAIKEQLAPLVKQTPKFFQHMPVVIDLNQLDKKIVINFAELLNCLRQHQIIPVGVRGGSEEQHLTAITAGLAILPNTKTEITETNQPAEKSSTPAPTFSKIITEPVRSGQQIYARNADLIVLAPVSPGAELLADGNIHIYNTLRGRALAGIMGNPHSRIFCQQLKAELVAIAGHYWVSEDLQNTPVKQNAHIYLENDRLQIGEF